MIFSNHGTHIFLEVRPVVPLVLVLVDESVLAQDPVLHVLIVAQYLVQLDLEAKGALAVYLTSVEKKSSLTGPMVSCEK